MGYISQLKDLNSPFNRGEILLILLVSLSLTVVIDTYHETDSSMTEKYSSGYETQIGYFEPDFFTQSDSEIIWEGYNTDVGPNKTIKIDKLASTPEGYKEFRAWNVSTNNYGLRNGLKPNQYEKEPSFKVIVLGSSSTLGYWMDHEDTYTQKLEKKLEENYSHNFQVINGGITNAGLIDYYLLTTTLTPELDPDIVIFSDIEPVSSRSRVELK